MLPDDEVLPAASDTTFEFDHGCQFTRADDPAMRELMSSWCEHGWAQRWEGPFGCTGDGDPCAEGDFFGLPGSQAPVYVGVGGMHMLPRQILAASSSTVRRGVRVADLLRRPDGKWELFGTSGEAAFHDTAEAEASKVDPASLGVFDAVLLTDASSSFSGWHRASAGAGVPDAVAARVRERVRVPLFSAMVALDTPLGDVVPFEGLTVKGGSSALWFAARSQGRPGAPYAAAECWTLVSRAAWAAAEIAREPMQDPRTGEFKPQTDEYLQAVPGPTLLAAFEAAISPYLLAAGMQMPRARYLQAQRWGSALPAPSGAGGRDVNGYSAATTVEVLGTRYEGAMPPLLAPTVRAEGVGAVGAEADFVAVDEQRIYYAGDFCSRRPPGFEAAALSGTDAAAHIRSVLCSTTSPA